MSIIARRLASLSALLTLMLPLSVYAFEIPPNDGYVTDTAEILTDAEEALLEDELDAYARETSNEIVIVTVYSLSGAVIADEAISIFRTWEVGGADNNNGIVILVSYEDHEAFLVTGYGLEGAIPDVAVYGILKEDVRPNFRDGNYAQGLATAVDSIKKHIGGEYTTDRYTESESSGGWTWLIFLLFIGVDWIGAYLARSKSWWLGGALGAVLGIILTILYSWWISIPILVLLGLLFDYIVSKGGGGKGGRGGRGGFGGWTSSSRRSSGSSSGFRGFGGGSTGGGGAGIKW